MSIIHLSDDKRYMARRPLQCCCGRLQERERERAPATCSLLPAAPARLLNRIFYRSVWSLLQFFCSFLQKSLLSLRVWQFDPCGSAFQNLVDLTFCYSVIGWSILSYHSGFRKFIKNNRFYDPTEKYVFWKFDLIWISQSTLPWYPTYRQTLGLSWVLCLNYIELGLNRGPVAAHLQKFWTAYYILVTFFFFFLTCIHLAGPIY